MHFLPECKAKYTQAQGRTTRAQGSGLNLLWGIDTLFQQGKRDKFILITWTCYAPTHMGCMINHTHYVMRICSPNHQKRNHPLLLNIRAIVLVIPRGTFFTEKGEPGM